MTNPDASVAPVAMILAGGSGTRFWPQGRRLQPKFLLPLSASGHSMIRDTYDRVASVVGRVFVVTGVDQADAVIAEVPDEAPDRILREPAARDTAAAIAWGIAQLAAQGVSDDTAVAVLPADAYVRDVTAFGQCIAAAATLARREDAIITIGIPPTHPATGYGYIQAGGELPTDDLPDWPSGSRAHRVDAFVEKPDRATAEGYLAGGHHLWNAGIFVATRGRLWAEVETHLPDLARAIKELPAPDSAAFAEAYSQLPKTSIDYGVMEKTRHIAMLTATFDWSDVGSWAAVHALRTDVGAVDDAGNVTAGDVVALDSTGCHLQTDAGLLAVVGLQDFVVVRHGDAVLVCPRDRSEEVKKIVEHLRDTGRHDAI